MPTSRRLVQFSEGKTAPDGGVTVYIDGAFDMFHPGHVETLKVGGGKGLRLSAACVRVGFGTFHPGHVGMLKLGEGTGAAGPANTICRPLPRRPSPCQTPAAPPLTPLPQLAKAQGDFLLVGLHSDEDVTNRRGCAGLGVAPSPLLAGSAGAPRRRAAAAGGATRRRRRRRPLRPAGPTFTNHQPNIIHMTSRLTNLNKELT